MSDAQVSSGELVHRDVQAAVFEYPFPQVGERSCLPLPELTR